ncbi:MAG: phosphotransferase [Hyphomicrobiales bacterium]
MAGTDPKTLTDPKRIAEGLAFWGGPVTAEPLGGGLTNANFVVRHGGRRFVVRIGDDIPQHQVMRFNERAASLAAHAAGLSPQVLHHEPGALVVAFIEGRTLTPEDLRRDEMLPRLVEVIRACHERMIAHLRGPLLMFWPFHILRDYAATLREGHSRWTRELPRLAAIALRLEGLVGPIDIAFCHNDLLAGNWIDDGQKLWLIDWDYAGFNSPLFDLANLASNNGFGEALERHLLSLYFGRPPDALLWQRFGAMRATSLMREAMWGMVSELHSKLDIDYVAYAREHLAKLETALARLDPAKG